MPPERSSSMPRPRRIAAATAIVLALLAGGADASADQAPGGPFGVGLVVGEPTGITGEYRFGRNAIEVALGLNTFEGKGFYVHGVYLFYLPALVSGGTAALNPYLGLGGILTGEDVRIGARVPFGLSIDFRGAPVKIFAEIAFRMMIVPDVKARVGGAIGFRYFF
jgi:hypothetical protein